MHRRRCASLYPRPVRLLAALALGSLGCPQQDLAPLEPCTVSGVAADVPVQGVDKVDLLFVIDDSSSMGEEQEKLAQQLPELVRILTSGKYDPNSEMQDFQPARDLHLGVVSSNMGANGEETGWEACDVDRGQGPGFGDDGVLIRSSRSCEGFALPGMPYQAYVPGPGTSPEQVARDFQCIASLGTDGCGFEQQLEAMYKALAPNDVVFAGGRGGHGNEKNRGFLREEAVLAVIHVSDEEDCSITPSGAALFGRFSEGPDVQFPDSGAKIGINLRCGYKADDTRLIHPVKRYVDGLMALKPDNRDRIIFGAIVGIPLELDQGAPGPQHFQSILQHSDMSFRPDPNSAGRGDPTQDDTLATPVCRDLASDGTTVLTSALPGRRFVEIAQAFGENGVVRSICAKSYEGALKTVIDKISKQLTGACLPRPLARNSHGEVECDVVEVLAPGMGPEACDPRRGRQFVEVRDEGNGVKRTVCRINQVAIDTSAQPPFRPALRPLANVDPYVGWFYDDFTPEAREGCKVGEQQRISFNPKSAEPQESTLRFECFQPVVRRDTEARGKDAVNSPCTNGTDCAARSDPAEAQARGAGYALVCDELTKTCQVPCEVDANCPPAWVCAAELGICQNPTCPPPNER